MRTLFKSLIVIGVLIFLLPLLLSPLIILSGLCIPNILSSSHIGLSQNNMTVALVFIFVLAIVGMSFIMKVFRTIFDNTSKGSYQVEPDETRMMQEIHQSLSSMEKRIESLETIILERSRRMGSG